MPSRGDSSIHTEASGTGAPRREIIYVDDAAKAIVSVLENYDKVEIPINVGSGSDVSIKQLAEMISMLVDYKGEIKWDSTKPDGQMVKLLNNTRMIKLLPPMFFTNPLDGLKKTIEWYKENV